MSIAILVYGNEFFQEFLKDLFLVHFYSIYIYISDIFFLVDEAFLSNYAYDSALYSIQKNHILNQSILKKKFMYLQIHNNDTQFHDNYIVLNPGKYYCMTFGLNTTKYEFVLEDGTIVPSLEEHVVFGITIDSLLSINMDILFQTIKSSYKQTPRTSS